VTEETRAPTLDDLVANRTMSKDMAATFRAMLAHAPNGTWVQTVEDDGHDVPRLLAASKGGYIVVPEVARMGRDGYIWGAPVREALGVITGDNGVPDKDAESQRRTCCTAGTSRATVSRMCRSPGGSSRADRSGTMASATDIRQR
jgi:hypothetical protein